jgi:hypothetical protein
MGHLDSLGAYDSLWRYSGHLATAFRLRPRSGSIEDGNSFEIVLNSSRELDRVHAYGSAYASGDFNVLCIKYLKVEL